MQRTGRSIRGAAAAAAGAGVPHARLAERGRGRGQETWIRLGRADADAIENFCGWLTTVPRARLPEHAPGAPRAAGGPARPRGPRTGRRPRPQHEALLADSLGIALLIVSRRCAGGARRVRPARRVRRAVRRHRTDPRPHGAAARQLASRARRRVHARTPVPRLTGCARHRSSTRSSPPLVTATSSGCCAARPGCRAASPTSRGGSAWRASCAAWKRWRASPATRAARPRRCWAALPRSSGWWAVGRASSTPSPSVTSGPRASS